MNHNFNPSKIDATKCVQCRRGVIDHTKMATCDACSNSGTMELYPNEKDENAMLLCSDCITKEREHQSESNQQARLQAEKERSSQESGILNIDNLIDKARTLDHAIQVRQDYYNAETISHHEVFLSIDADITITAKQYAKANFLQSRYEEYQKTLFELTEKVAELNSKQRVVKEAFNKMANTLREEERAKLRLLSPDYKPGVVKAPAKPRAHKPPKFDKKALIDEAANLINEGIPAEIATWSYIQGICVRRQMTPKQAADVIRKTLGAAK